MTPDQMAGLMARAMPGARLWSAAEFAALVARPGALVFGDGQACVIGQVVADEAEIFLVLTDPEHRRRGLARARLADFEGSARGAGAGRVILEVAADNAAALGLYTAQGYRAFAARSGYYPRPTGDAVDALMLERRL
ncbi:GNAT family N-acetyltransferase [Roseovarius sp. SYSU LYC5161]|jgi:ribosomal-protein-alanine N-acetyltransferase|uniref:GNAT family N-acetyltransferase n=1 Tax=Roseovarius halophilus (ex Wu et al. 2025) TaxID=3376060 RepID=UPI00399B9FAB